MTTLPARFAATLERLGVTDRPMVLAVSGGPDSLALMELTAMVSASLRLVPHVAHFDHGIHPDSGRIAERVRVHAEKAGFSFQAGAGQLGPAASETTARAARRAWLEQVASEAGGPILTAHHQDDQLETVLMRFLEGSGPLGLAGMAEVRGPWVRPLLGSSRAELAALLTERHITAWDDPSNQEPRHLRGWVRTALLPLLAERFPRLRDNLLAARDVFEENRIAWGDVTSALPGLDLVVEADGASVAADGLNGYSSAVVRALLRSLGRQVDIGVGRGELDRVQALVRKGHTGQSVDLNGGAGAALSFGRLRLFRPLAPLGEYDALIPPPPGALTAGGWRLETADERGPEALERVSYSTWLPSGQLARVRSWRSGDRIRPLGGRGSRLVVRCMQDARVSRHLRPTWPVVEIAGEVIWVPGVCRAESAVPAPGMDAVRIDARPG